MSINVASAASSSVEVTLAPQTQTYIHQLSSLAASIPTLSSSLALSAANKSQSIPSSEFNICSHCLATVIPGISGSIWVAKAGVPWLSCQNCGWRTKGRASQHDRSRNGAELATASRGRASFERVVKRRRGQQDKGTVRELKCPGASTSATTSSGIQSSKSQVETVSSGPDRPRGTAAQSVLESIQKRVKLSPPSETEPDVAVMESAAFRSTAAPAIAPISQPVAKYSKSLTTVAPAASTTPTKSTSRKRKGQVNGLAEMLERKRQKEAEEQAAKSGTGGLLDFLTM